jgi:hypothetical protein
MNSPLTDSSFIVIPMIDIRKVDSPIIDSPNFPIIKSLTNDIPIRMNWLVSDITIICSLIIASPIFDIQIIDNPIINNPLASVNSSWTCPTTVLELFFTIYRGLGNE